MDHKYNVRIYYEDTDAAQVVFMQIISNILKELELNLFMKN